jgi:hypothetical protein
MCILPYAEGVFDKDFSITLLLIVDTVYDTSIIGENDLNTDPSEFCVHVEFV